MSADKDSPRVTPEGEQAAEARRLRLAQELRANLAKRKAQARARAGADPESDARAGEDTDGDGNGGDEGNP